MAGDASGRRSTLAILSEQLVGIVAVGTFGVGVLAYAFGVENAWVIFVVGWFLLVPILGILSDTIEELVQHADSTPEVDETADALETLRERYARGEIDELTFERKVERLLETETVADAEENLSRGVEDGTAGAEDTERDRDRDPAFEV